MTDLATIDPSTDVMSMTTMGSLLDERLDPQAVLNALVRSVAGVIGAALSTADGRGLAHSDHLVQDPCRAAMAAATMGLSGQLMGVVGGRQLDEVIVRSDNGDVVVYSLGARAVLTVLARPGTDLHHVGVEVRARLDSLRAAAGSR